MMRLTMQSHPWQPPTDVFETEEAVLVRVEIAGMKEDDFSLEVNGRSISIRGSRQDTPERRSYHQMEIRYGEFEVAMDLPCPVEIERIEAVYNNGFLRVVLPKARPKHIPILE